METLKNHCHCVKKDPYFVTENLSSREYFNGKKKSSWTIILKITKAAAY